MKNVISFIATMLFAGALFGQSLNDFYNKKFEIYTPYSGMSSMSNTQDSLDINPSMKFWGVVNLGWTISKSNQWGASFYCGDRQLGDLFFLLKGIVSKSAKKDFRGVYYLSDMGFLPNLRLGLNVIGKDKFVVNIGLYHSYYITNGSSSVKSDWLALGPNIYVDKTITDFLAVRISTGPMFSYANGKKLDPPKIWEHKIELFTKPGLFAGIDFLQFSKRRDGLGNEVKISRYDLKLGIRF